MTFTRCWAAALVALLLTIPGAASAAAPDDLITDVTTEQGSLRVTLAQTELPRGAEPQDTVSVTIDGEAVAARVSSTAGLPTAALEARTVVLVLDTSGSMEGPGLRDAQQAAAGLLAALPADVRVGLVTFADEVVVRAEPTADRAAVSAALQQLVAAGNTRLYDSVSVALSVAGTTGQRRVMFLSDGRDDGSTADVAQATSAIVASGVTVDAVDASDDGSAASGLSPLAEAGKGRAVSASGAQASEVFAEIAKTYATQLSFVASLPPNAAGQDVRLRVEVAGARGPLVQERVVSVPAAPTPAWVAGQSATGVTASQPLSFWVMLAAVGIGTFLLLAVAVTTGDSRAEDVRRTRYVLGTYGFTARTPVRRAEASPVGDSQLAQSALQLADRVVEARGSGAKIALALDRAGLTWRPHEWVVLWTVSTVLGGALAALLSGGGLFVLLLGALGGWLAPRTWLKFRAGRRQKAFLEALPDALQLLASSLSSGYSLAQALDALVQEGSQPMAGEMGRALAEARIGRPLEDALDAVGDRMECEDFRWIVMAVRVQRQVGGNLAEVLARVCATMRDRASLRRQVKALSAEGRISAYILIALPVTLGLFMFFFRGDYFRPMHTETVGIIALSVTVVMLALGAVWMNKLVKVDL